MPIAVRCSGCSRRINAPDNAAGKRIKCPACKTILQVPAQAAAPKVAATTAGPAASLPTGGSLGFSPFDFDQKPDDSLLTDADFQTRKQQAAQTEIPKGSGPKKKRPARYYFAPAVTGMVSAGLNIAAALGMVILMIVAVVAAAKAEESGIAMLIGLFALRVLLFAAFTIGGSIHAIFACMNLMHRTSRPACGVAIGEFFINPIAFGLIGWLNLNWVAGLIIGGVFALWNWTSCIWIAIAISGKQAKIDFEEVNDDEVEELAAELQRRTSMMEKSGH